MRPVLVRVALVLITLLRLSEGMPLEFDVRVSVTRLAPKDLMRDSMDKPEESEVRPLYDDWEDAEEDNDYIDEESDREMTGEENMTVKDVHDGDVNEEEDDDDKDGEVEDERDWTNGLEEAFEKIDITSSHQDLEDVVDVDEDVDKSTRTEDKTDGGDGIEFLSTTPTQSVIELGQNR